LDNFKPVNDSYGHEVGDQLLIEVAQRIRANIREEDTVSRQGGDEFALLLGDISSFSHCGQMLKRLHQALAQPYVIDDLTVDIGASSGITFYPLDEGDIDTLLRHADQAMYQAKLAGKNRYHFFNTEQDQKTINTNTRSQEIQQGFEEGELCLYYQPKVNMKTGDVFGAEALIRWIHPEKGMIPPLEFLPSIEDSDLEIEIGQWVITEAIKQLDEWMKHGITIEISVNVSSYHLLSDTFFAHLSDALEQYPEIPSHYLQLEILESSALGDLKTVSAVIKTCRDVLGVNIALDDFGTGYSSLTHLRNLPANTIKIDQSFVRDMLDDPSDYAIIDGVIGLAESFHRDVIAEGVETTEHGLMLLLLGCHNAQGYGIARPMPASDIPLWLETYVPNKEWTKCAAQQRTVKENKIKLLMVMLEYWFHHIEDAFLSRKSNDELGVFVDYRKSNLRSWVERARQEYLFDKEWLDSLALENEKMHQLANSLCIQHKEGVNKGSSADLVELEQAYKRVTTIIANQ
ncbi:MAG: EAL domain-containing protein, partial [Gammaproteobacteria bacterium]|nr:EAL domain-containing protein [Gammaproteobacteria bacterium]